MINRILHILRSTLPVIVAIFISVEFSAVTRANAQSVDQIRDRILHDCDAARNLYSNGSDLQLDEWTPVLGDILKLDLTASSAAVSNPQLSFPLKINDSHTVKLDSARIDALPLVGVEEQMLARRCVISILQSSRVKTETLLPILLDFASRLELDDELRVNVDRILINLIRGLKISSVTDDNINLVLGKLSGNRPSLAKDLLWSFALFKPERVGETLFINQSLGDEDTYRLMARSGLSKEIINTIVLQHIKDNDAGRVRRALFISRQIDISPDQFTELIPQFFAFNNRGLVEEFLRFVHSSETQLKLGPPLLYLSDEQIEMLMEISLQKGDLLLAETSQEVLGLLARNGTIDSRILLSWLSDVALEKRLIAAEFSMVIPTSFQEVRAAAQRIIDSGELPELLAVISGLAKNVTDESSAKGLLRVVRGALVTRPPRDQDEILRVAIEDLPAKELRGSKKIWLELFERYLVLPANIFVESVRKRSEVYSTIAQTLVKLGADAVPLLKKIVEKNNREVIRERALRLLGDKFATDNSLSSFLVSQLGIEGPAARAVIFKILRDRSDIPKKAVRDALRSPKETRKLMAAVISWRLGDRSKVIIPTIKTWLGNASCDEFWHGAQEGFFSEPSLQSVAETRLSECLVSRDGFSHSELERLLTMNEISNRVLNGLLEMILAVPEAPKSRAVPILKIGAVRGVDNAIVTRFYESLLNGKNSDELEVALEYGLLKDTSPEVIAKLKAIASDDSNSLHFRCVAYGYLSRLSDSSTMDWEETIRDLVRSENLQRCLSKVERGIAIINLFKILPSEPKRRVATVLRLIREEFPEEIVGVGVDTLRAYSAEVTPHVRNEGIWGLARAIPLSLHEQDRLLESLYFESGELAQIVLANSAYHPAILAIKERLVAPVEGPVQDPSIDPSFVDLAKIDSVLVLEPQPH